MGDLLSAAGLLLGVVSVLYGLWLPEMTAALDRPIKLQPADRESDYKFCRRVYFARALPLAAAAVLFALLFVPPALRIVVGTVRSLWRDPVSAVVHYDAVRASLVVVSLSLVALAAYILTTAVRLRNHCARQDPGAPASR
jgi:hypothetical protein